VSWDIDIEETPIGIHKRYTYSLTQPNDRSLILYSISIHDKSERPNIMKVPVNKALPNST